MAKVKKEDIKELTTDELLEKIKGERVRLQKLRFNHAISPLDNPSQLKYLKRDIARMMSEVKNRELQKQK